jgi:hypothetical protein
MIFDTTKVGLSLKQPVNIRQNAATKLRFCTRNSFSV